MSYKIKKTNKFDPFRGWVVHIYYKENNYTYYIYCGSDFSNNEIVYVVEDNNKNKIKELRLIHDNCMYVEDKKFYNELLEYLKEKINFKFNSFTKLIDEYNRLAELIAGLLYFNIKNYIDNNEGLKLLASHPFDFLEGSHATKSQQSA